MRKILLNKDNPTKAEIKQVFTQRRSLIIPTSLAMELDHYCQGCGGTFSNKKQVEYFGQIFCDDCVKKWKNGQS